MKIPVYVVERRKKGSKKWEMCAKSFHQKEAGWLLHAYKEIGSSRNNLGYECRLRVLWAKG